MCTTNKQAEKITNTLLHNSLEKTKKTETETATKVNSENCYCLFAAIVPGAICGQGMREFYRHWRAECYAAMAGDLRQLLGVRPDCHQIESRRVELCSADKTLSVC